MSMGREEEEEEELDEAEEVDEVGSRSRTPTFQFLLVVEGDTLVFKVPPQNRVQQQRFLLQNAFLSGLWSRTLTFLSVEAFKIFAQVTVHPQLHALQLNGSPLRMRRFKGFFALFSQNKKSATVPPHSGSTLPPHSSPWTPAAYDASMVLEEEEEESEDEPAEYVQHDGRWWGCEWVPARQRYCC